MKPLFVLCVCLSLCSVPALAEKPISPQTQQFERKPYDSQNRRHEQAGKERRSKWEGQKENSAERVYRSKKLRIHKHPPRGSYSQGYPIYED